MIAFISAHRTENDAITNHKNQKRLSTALEIGGFNFKAAEGKFEGQLEPSFIVYDVPQKRLVELERLAMKFNQDSILIAFWSDIKIHATKPEGDYTYDIFHNTFMTTDQEPTNLYI